MHYGWNGWAPGAYGLGAHLGFPWGGIVMLLLFLVLVGLVIFAMLRLSKSRGTETKKVGPAALDILSERFARGEIDAESYRAMKEELGRK